MPGVSRTTLSEVLRAASGNIMKWELLVSKSSFTHWFIQQIFIGRLLQARPCAKCWECSDQQQNFNIVVLSPLKEKYMTVCESVYEGELPSFGGGLVSGGFLEEVMKIELRSEERVEEWEVLGERRLVGERVRGGMSWVVGTTCAKSLW